MWEYVVRWLKLAIKMVDKMIELLVVEQLVTMLPPGPHNWVTRLCPTSIDEAVMALESYWCAEESWTPREGATVNKGPPMDRTPWAPCPSQPAVNTGGPSPVVLQPQGDRAESPQRYC